jgi:hypothetical protein
MPPSSESSAKSDVVKAGSDADDAMDWRNASDLAREFSTFLSFVSIMLI